MPANLTHDADLMLAPLPPKFPEPDECPNCHQPYALDHGDDLRKCVRRLLDRIAHSRQFYALRHDTMSRIVRERGLIDADAYWNIVGNGRPSPTDDTPEIELVRELNTERHYREDAETKIADLMRENERLFGALKEIAIGRKDGDFNDAVTGARLCSIARRAINGAAS